MSIRPLPDEVVAQIRSSTAVVSLTGVILELIKNSLDAKAARIHATVDFARGGCTVEDDGLGITPAEFGEHGALGKLYWTSKYLSDEPHLGQHGTFLASLSAMSLLTIISHHHAYRSHNSVSFHHSQAIERQMPTPAHNNIHGKHGTRVTVRNLFGNMPVRVKQRALVTDQKQEQVRLRDSLRRELVGLLLSWQGPVSLTIRDSDNNTIANFNNSNAVVRGSGRDAAANKPRSTHLSSLLHVLTQAKYVTINEWPSWVPASASTAALSIKGAISLNPSPTKQGQFISFGIRPLSGDRGCNELYDEVNRLFAMSSFGTVEDDADVDEQEQLRRQSDKRFKSDGYTNRQLKVRKGVDRYPMFHFRITLKDRQASEIAEERFIEDESNLQAVLSVFSAMITQWLSIHQFRPRKLHSLADRPRTAPSLLYDPSDQARISSKKRQALSSIPTTRTQRPTTAAADSAKRQRMAMAPVENTPGQSRPQAFADWSRIKSGKSSFFSMTHASHKVQATAHTDRPGVPSNSKGTLNKAVTTTSSGPSVDHQVAANSTDGVVLWTDPVTKRTHPINARTGNLIPPRRSQIDSAALSPLGAHLKITDSLRLSSRSVTADVAKTPWLDDLLQNWNNPVFKPSEQGIQQMSLQGDMEDSGDRKSHLSHTHCSPFDMLKAFSDAGMSSAKLSKIALRGAEIISQVDKKFILVKMAALPADNSTKSTDIMVLVDQHAADERIQVEALLSNLCRPRQSATNLEYNPNLGLGSSVEVSVLSKPLQFAVSAQEHIHFEAFAANFARWGILYSISTSVNFESKADKDRRKLSVTALPPAISERCKGDPHILISFLRSAVWKYVESPPLSSSVSDDPSSSWVKQIASCPPGLVDMINSRACRSAIMFNDELTLDECKALVKKLADCVFPFMCAHGRPSMVPIVDMGRVGDVAQSQQKENGHGDSFVSVWKSWRGQG